MIGTKSRTPIIAPNTHNGIIFAISVFPIFLFDALLWLRYSVLVQDDSEGRSF